MKSVVKVLAVVLAMAACVVPLGPTAHCEDGHEAECATECDCVCHSAPAFAGIERTLMPTDRRSESAVLADMLPRGRLAIADIFRPPTAA